MLEGDAVSPAEIFFDVLRRTKKDVPKNLSVAFFCSGKTCSVLVASAQMGFKTLSDYFLRKLAAALGMPFQEMPVESRPATVEERVEMLVRKVLHMLCTRDLPQASCKTSRAHIGSRLSPATLSKKFDATA